MSRFLAFLLIFLGVSTVHSQHNLVLYNMQQVPQSQLLNPGQLPLVKGYVGFPGLSGIRVAAGHTGFSYADFSKFEEAEDFDFTGLNGLVTSDENKLLFDSEVRILNFGFRVGKGFINFDIGETAGADAAYSRTLLSLFQDIQQSQLADSPYDLSQVGANASYYRSYSIGYAHQLLPNLSAGLRFRYLQGMANLWTVNDNFGLLYNGEGSSLLTQGSITFYGAGLNQLSDLDPAGFFLQGGNTGFALDFGGVYRLNDKIELSFSALNLGKINWKKDVAGVTVAASSFRADDIDEHLGQWEEVIDSLLNGDLVYNQASYSTRLPRRYYIGANYYVLPSTSVGLLINPISYNGDTELAFALSANTYLAKFFGLSLALAHSPYSSFQLGVGTSLALGPLQLYVLTDNLTSALNWETANSAQAQLGLNFNFGKLRRQETLAPRNTLATVPAEPFFAEESTPTPAKEKPRKVDKQSREGEDEMAGTTKPAVTETAEQTKLPKEKRADTKATPTRREDRATEATAAAPAATVSPATSRTVRLAGTTRDLENGEALKGVAVEVHRIDENGARELSYIGSFYSGEVSVQLLRGYAYQVTVSRQGYEPKEIQLDADQLTNGPAEINRDFLLRPASDVAPTAPRPATVALPLEETPVTTPPVATPERETPPPAPPVVEKKEEKVEPTPSKPNTGTRHYKLTGATSLRSGPDHTTTVLLRLETGDQVVVLEGTDQWWWKVYFNGKTGYVKAQLLAPK